MQTSTRVLLFATHIHSTNGYCVVGHALANELAQRKDIELTYFGFQNCHKNANHIAKRTLPSNVFIYDALENENPKGMGFGFDQVTEFVTMNKPDVCIIFNDMYVVSVILDKLKAVPNKNFKVIVYIDQVYSYQQREHVKRLNEEANMVLAFTPYWQKCIVDQGLTKPCDFLRHGFNPYQHYPVPRKLARAFLGLKDNDFIILNLNRNQPRKRWDICMQAFAEIVSRHLTDPIKLLIATAVNGSWNLIDIYERELKKRGITLEEGRKHIIIIDNPQQLTDDEVNVLYNAADIGFSTADGEGFGLCSFQQAAIGVPQVAPALGGYLDFFTKESSILIEPKMSLYIDNSRDLVGSEYQLVDWKDCVDGIEAYYANRDLIAKHGSNARKNILANYKWSDIGDKLYNICKDLCGHPKCEKRLENENDISLEDLQKIITVKENLNNNITKTTKSKHRTSTSVKDRLKEKLKARKQESLDIASLLDIKNKIDKLLSDQSKVIQE